MSSLTFGKTVFRLVKNLKKCYSFSYNFFVGYVDGCPENKIPTPATSNSNFSILHGKLTQITKK